MTCAVCVSVTGPFTREPIGRNNAMVNVCHSCAFAPVVAKRGPDVEYQPDDRCPTQTDARFARAPGAAWTGGMAEDNEVNAPWAGGNKRKRVHESTRERLERRKRAEDLKAERIAERVGAKR